MGVIPQSGYQLTEKYQHFDADKRFDLGEIILEEPSVCIAGEILTGQKKPDECTGLRNPVQT